MAYVDGFVMIIKKKDLAAYRAVATKAGKMWKKYGALDYKECVMDDHRVAGKLTFKNMTKVKPSELVIFSFITYKSRAVRDAANKKVMQEFEMPGDAKAMPFDMNKMAVAGFKPIVDLG